MESGINKKLKVVWICHFSNEIVQNRLNVHKRIKEFAPWIQYGINEFKKIEEIELHIVSPHEYIYGIKEYEESGIFYHFFNSGVPFYGRHWPQLFKLDRISNFALNRLRVKQIVDSISPDLIHLWGAENAYYSSSILDLDRDIPKLVTIQGFVKLINLTLNTKFNRDIKKRVMFEDRILRNMNYFTRNVEYIEEELLKVNPRAKVYYAESFGNYPKVENTNKSLKYEYDIIFFARVVKEKGIEDLLEAVGIAVADLPEIKVAVVGIVEPNYELYLKERCVNLGIEENVHFLGFLAKQEDVHKVLINSRLSVLPTYMDMVSGTNIEAMFSKTPVITYGVGGILDLLKLPTKIVEIVEVRNVQLLARKIVFLLKNSQVSEEMAERAFNYASKRWNNRNAALEFVKVYKELINNDVV